MLKESLRDWKKNNNSSRNSTESSAIVQRVLIEFEEDQQDFQETQGMSRRRKRVSKDS